MDGSMNKSQDHARALLEKARGDLLALERLAGDQRVPLWTAGFHAQQAVEKSLKAVLAVRQVSYPFTHDLLTLLDLVSEHNILLPPESESFGKLSPFGAVLRYDSFLPAPSTSQPDRLWLINITRHTLAWAENLIL